MSVASSGLRIGLSRGAFRLPLTTRARNGIIAVAVVVLVTAMVVAGVLGESYATLPVTLRVTSTEDPLDIGATTRATVALRNRGSEEIAPRFSLSWLPEPYYWRIVSGPLVLKPGQSADYTIAALDSISAPADGEAFQIKVNDSRSITYAISAPIEIPKRQLPIVNPSLSLWTQRDPATGFISPAGWSMYEHHDRDDHTTIRQADVLGVQAARFHVVQAGHRDPGLWAHTGLMQQIPFPTRPFEIRVLSRTPYEAISGGWLVTAFGIEIRDGSQNVIWLLFQHTGNGDREYDLPNGYHIKVYDVPFGAWATRTIDLPALYQELHRKQPRAVMLKLFLGASSAQANDVEGYIAGLQLVPGAQGTSAAK